MSYESHSSAEGKSNTLPNNFSYRISCLNELCEQICLVVVSFRSIRGCNWEQMLVVFYFCFCHASLLTLSAVKEYVSSCVFFVEVLILLGFLNTSS